MLNDCQALHPRVVLTQLQKQPPQPPIQANNGPLISHRCGRKQLRHPSSQMTGDAGRSV